MDRTKHYECSVCKSTFVTEDNIKDCPKCGCEALLVDDVSGETGEIEKAGDIVFNFQCQNCGLETATNLEFQFCPLCGADTAHGNIVVSRNPIPKLHERSTIAFDIGPNVIFVGIVLLIFLIMKS